ncbi:hypothetical protein RUMHYD_02157 [Blautia hydrogenotrophica DSM 10507]|uniref:Uncharacterized protein n=1 Tax=Blautia hydrogenotrophica (strain DSM 10507 / JCM 14656 / S5a33) TaxID=476272 RepID=C0CMR9_BLAHS|nr:hypothetical protein RUMHYD_02157 [Blautia hydrogenotrophica DSM 10507]
MRTLQEGSSPQSGLRSSKIEGMGEKNGSGLVRFNAVAAHFVIVLAD